MQKMHWCNARVNLSGQGFTIIWFDNTNLISWPEAQVIMAIHGEENVFEIRPAAISETTPHAEKERLQLKYGYKPVEHCFPGRMPRMEMLMPAETENLPHADEYGQLTGALIAAENGNGNDNGHPVEEPPAPTPIPPQPDQDEEDEEDAATQPGVPPPAVFKPGRPRPAKGA